jgi:hypothetical protein
MKRKIGEYKICVDQGLPRSGDACGTFVGPVTKRQARRLHCNVRDYLLNISNIHTSLGQASEWGMHGLQGTFPLCKSRLPSDAAQLRLVIKVIILIHNFRTDYVGYSQIQSVFDREYVRCENLHMDMIEYHSIISVRGIMIVMMWMGLWMGVEVMKIVIISDRSVS